MGSNFYLLAPKQKVRPVASFSHPEGKPKPRWRCFDSDQRGQCPCSWIYVSILSPEGDGAFRRIEEFGIGGSLVVLHFKRFLPEEHNNILKVYLTRDPDCPSVPSSYSAGVVDTGRDAPLATTDYLWHRGMSKTIVKFPHSDVIAAVIHHSVPSSCCKLCRSFCMAHIAWQGRTTILHPARVSPRFLLSI